MARVVCHTRKPCEITRGIRRLVSYVGIIIAAQSTVSAQTSQGEREIRQHEENWCVALKTRNAALLDSILAPDYVEVTSSGDILSRAEALAGVTDSAGSTTACGNSGVTVRIYRDAAVARGVMEQAGFSHGVPYSGKHIIFTDTYIRQKGRWRCVASQSTLTRTVP